MNITKIGHCCLLVETKNLRILTDPGSFSVGQNSLTNIDIILITHEHPDHLHVESVQEVLKNNPQALVITNSSVGKILDQIGVTYILTEGQDSTIQKDMTFRACDAKHEEIFEEFGQVQNTGYMIDDRLFYPGDAYSIPNQDIEILALPVAGPWCRIRDAIQYAIKAKPKKAFPVHDGMLQADRIGSSHGAPKKALAEHGIEFVVMNAGDTHLF